MSIAREWENVNNTECMRKRKGKEFILKLISLSDIVVYYLHAACWLNDIRFQCSEFIWMFFVVVFFHVFVVLVIIIDHDKKIIIGDCFFLGTDHDLMNGSVIASFMKKLKI